MEACSSVRGITLGRSISSDRTEEHLRGATTAVQSGRFTIQETQATRQEQFRNVTTCNPSFLYKRKYALIRVCGENLELL